MPAVEVGRICVKITGREAGRKCVIVDVIDEKFVLITGPRKISKVKRRRANIGHIEPTEMKIDIRRGATDDEVLQALSEAEKMEEISKIVKPTTT